MQLKILQKVKGLNFVGLDIENNDEFGELSRYVNAFIDKIHTSIDQVKTTTMEL